MEDSHQCFSSTVSKLTQSVKQNVEFLSLRQSGHLTNPIKDDSHNKSDSNTVGIWTHQTDKTVSFIYKFSSLPSWRIWWEYDFATWIHSNTPLLTEMFVKAQSPRIETLVWDSVKKRCKPEFFDPKNTSWPRSDGKPLYLFLQQRLEGISINKYWESLHSLKKEDSWCTIFFNILDIMAQTQIAQDECEFTHYDMHLGNTYSVPSSYQWLWYRLDDDGADVDIIIPSFGYQRMWIDYEFSYHKGMRECKFNYSFHLINWGILPATFSPFADMIRFTTCAWSHCCRKIPALQSHYEEAQKLFQTSILAHFKPKDGKEKCPLSFTKLGVMIFDDHIRHFVFTKLKLVLSISTFILIEPIYYTLIALLYHHVTVSDFQDVKQRKIDTKQDLEQLVKFFVIVSQRPNLDQGNTLVNDLFAFQNCVEISWSCLLAEWKFHCDANEKDLLKWRNDLVEIWNPSITSAFMLYAQWTKELKNSISYFTPLKPLRMMEWMMKLAKKKNVSHIYKTLRVTDSIRFIGCDSSAPCKTSLQELGWSQKKLDQFVAQNITKTPFEFSYNLRQES